MVLPPSKKNVSPKKNTAHCSKINKSTIYKMMLIEIRKLQIFYSDKQMSNVMIISIGKKEATI